MSIDLKKKPGFNKPLGGDTKFQYGGAELSAKGLKDRAVEAIMENPEAAGLKINSVDVYAKPEEGMLYYVAHYKDGEISGSTTI